MKMHTARQTWMIVLGWMIMPGLCLFVGYFLGRLLGTLAPAEKLCSDCQWSNLLAESASVRKIYFGGLLGMLTGCLLGLFTAGILTAQAIKQFFPLSNKQIGVVAAGWLWSFIIGSIATFVLSFLVAIPVSQIIDSPYDLLGTIFILILISFPIGAISGGFLMGIVGSFITNKVLRKIEPGLDIKTFKAINLRWGLGFLVGGLLGGIFIGFGIGYLLTIYSFSKVTMIGAIASAIGFAILGLCGSLIGGRFMLKRLSEYAKARDTIRTG